MFGTMCNTLEKMFSPEDMPEQANVSPLFAKTGGLRDLSLSVGSTDA